MKKGSIRISETLHMTFHTRLACGCEGQGKKWKSLCLFHIFHYHCQPWDAIIKRSPMEKPNTTTCPVPLETPETGIVQSPIVSSSYAQRANNQTSMGRYNNLNMTAYLPISEDTFYARWASASDVTWDISGTSQGCQDCTSQ